MAMLKRSRAKRLVLDIGTSAIRLCELSQTKAGYQLTKYYQRELSMDPSLEEEEKDEQRAQVLQDLLKEAKIRHRKTIVAVPGQSVFTRNRPLPPVPEHKVTQIVRYEIQQQIPFSLDEIALDYQVLNRTEVGGYDVMMAAIKVDVVDKHLEVLKKVKKSIDMVDVSPLAAYNWLSHTGEFGDDGQCVALIDLGATTTDIVIQKDNQFKFTRSLHTGGNDVTNAISSAFNMSWEDAEKLKREKGFAPTGDANRDGKGGEVIGRVTGRLINEINRSFAYFRSQPGGGPVSRVVVTGGGACLRNIIPYMQRQLNIEVRIAQPLAGLAIAPSANEASEHPEQACVVLGLALRCLQEVPVQINLIPPRVKEASRQKEQVLYWFLTLLTVYLIMASTIPSTAQKDENVQERIKQLKRVLAEYDASIINNPESPSSYEDDLNSIKLNVEGFVKEVQKMDNMKSGRTFWLDYMREINDLRPNGIAFSSMQTGVIGGVGNTGEAGKLLMAKQNAQGEDGAVEETVAAPVAAPPSGGGGMLGMLSANIGGGQAVAKKYELSGFPGISPGNIRSTSLPGGLGGGGGGTSGIAEPNCIILFGYAHNVPLLQTYVERLQSSDLFLENGVYFHVKYLEPVGDGELDNANLGDIKSSANTTRNSGGSLGGGGGLGTLGSSGNIASSGGGGGGTKGFGSWGIEVYPFHIDVQFLGETSELPQ